MATRTLDPLQTGGDPQENMLSGLLSRAYVLNWELILYTVILLFAVFTRFYDLGTRVMSHDESLHTQFSYTYYTEGFYEHDPMMHGPILFHATALSYYLLGDNDFSARAYTAVVGIMLVMSPLLFRRWLGKWGALLASFMLLISPLILYYSRYIRHDIPSIMSAVLMAWAALMYLSGPENQRRRAHWLYVIAAAMLWNLGSKETAFIYVAIFGAFILLYWLVRMAQYFFKLHGEQVFNTLIVSFLLAGVASLMMIVVINIAFHNVLVIHEETILDETLEARVGFIVDQTGRFFSGEGIQPEFASFVNWTLAVVVVMLAITAGPALWAYRQRRFTFSMLDLGAIVASLLIFWIVAFTNSMIVGAMLAIAAGLLYAAFRLRGQTNWPFLRHMALVLALALVTCLVIIVVEELSHQPSRIGDDPPAPAVPGEVEVAEPTSGLSTFPLIFAWVGMFVGGGILLYSRRAGWWKTLDKFPELDILIIMGSLILPWLTAVIIVMVGGRTGDFEALANSLPTAIYNLVPVGNVNPAFEAERVGQVVVGFLAWVPMMFIAVATGITWNWRRYLIASAIFHALFAFFFTTVFSNIEGLATGMVYSLQYWFEQQGERRGSQPQYYYLLVIMPVYEFLPAIGGVLAMIAGMVLFWRKRRNFEAERQALAATTPNRDDADTDLVIDDTPADEDGAPPPGDDLTRMARTAERPVYAYDAPAAAPVAAVDHRPGWILDRMPFLLFVGWWAVLNLIGYTLAGEKMPWLGTHMTVPLILLTGWYFGRIFKDIDGQRFRESGWMYLFIVPLLMVALFQVIAPYLSGREPFQGVTRQQLSLTYTWLGAVGLSAVLVWIIFWLTERTGWRHFRQMAAIAIFAALSVVTINVAQRASYINYDLATEYLVYAHGAPGNRIVVDQLADMSLRTTGGMNIAFAHDDGMNWPGVWYFREFPDRVYYGSNPTRQQLENVVAIAVRQDGTAEVERVINVEEFQVFRYPRMWWPSEDYKGLTSARINNLLDLQNSNAALRRRGIFDIWWARDYDTFGVAINKDFSLENWPVRDDVYFYVRRDFAAQVWPFGIGGGTAVAAAPEAEVSACVANWQPVAASVVFDSSSARMNLPIGLGIAPDGRVVVAEDANHRLSVFDSNGGFLQTIGQQGPRDEEGASFERPHSVAFAPDGRMVVADTWNHQIRVFGPDGSYITSWGQEFTAGLGAPQQPSDGLWGPRDVTVDDQGRVYVADTGNKRVRVYTLDGVWITDIGTGGSGPGELDEPAGLAVHSNGRLYVADTWNQRIAVFTLDGVFITNFDIQPWIDLPSNRPYLALDESRELLYVGDPDAGRVLVYNTSGACIGSFGQFNNAEPNAGELGSVSGLAVGDDGSVYTVDTINSRVLRFPPFPLPLAEPPGAPSGDLSMGEPEATPEVSPEIGMPDSEAPENGDADSGGMETTPETTPETIGESGTGG